MCSAIHSTVIQYRDKTFITERWRHRTKFVHQDTSSLMPVLPTTMFCVNAKSSAKTSLLAPFSDVSGWLRNCTLQTQTLNDWLSYIHCNCAGIILWSVEANMHVTIGRKEDPQMWGQNPDYLISINLATYCVRTRVVHVHTETLLRSLIGTKWLTK